MKITFDFKSKTNSLREGAHLPDAEHKVHLLYPIMKCQRSLKKIKKNLSDKLINATQLIYPDFVNQTIF